MGKYSHIYRKSWENLPEFKGWLCSVSGESDSAWCSYCNKKLSAYKTILRDHRLTRLHIRGENMAKQSGDMIKDLLKKDIKIVEAIEVGEGADFQTLQIEDEHPIHLRESVNVVRDPSKIKVGILTISDRCFNNEAEDVSGPVLTELVEDGSLFPGEVVDQKCSPDDKECIQEVLIEWADDLKLDLAISTGGTGVAPRDVTPEAVKEILDKEVIGMSIKIIAESLKITPLAMLSRPVSGIRGKTLIVTLPGSSKASQECLRFIAPSITHAIELLNDKKTLVERTHAQIQGQPIESNSELNYNEKDVSVGEDENDDMVHSKAEVNKIAQRPRQSPYPLIAVEQAQAKVLSKANRLSYKQINVSESLGHALGEDVYAAEPLPPFPASIKDGYAVVSSDGSGPRQVIGQSCAGTEPHLEEVSPGTCIRINTGAPVPPGADAVIQVEDTQVLIESEDGSEELEIQILKAPSEGQDIRPKGSDISRGELLLTSGMLIGPAEMGVLASAGVSVVTVHRKPIVGILSTGNELQKPFIAPLEEGRIYDSNKVTLMSLLEQHSIPSYDAGIAVDTPTGILRAIRKALRKVDVLVTSGGVSMGDRDVLKPVLISDLKAKIHFAQVFMKPGKPTTFATCTFNGQPKLILGLPGNPVSAMVTAHLYLLPLCKKMSGQSDYHNTVVRAKLASKTRLDRRPEYHRATLSWSSADNLPTAHSTGNQISSRLMSCASAQALLQLPPATDETTSLPAGSVVEALVLNL